MGIVTAKYAHQASGYNQLLHADYPNHMLVVPRHELGYQQVEFFVYLTDVTAEDGATRFVSWQKTKDIPVERHTLNYVDYAELYDDPSDAAAPAGSVVAYRPDVYHRSADFTDPTRYRVMLHVSFRHRDAGWGGYQAWPFRGFSSELSKFVQQATPRQLALMGVPEPGPPVLERGDAGRRPSPLPGPRHDPVEGRAALTRPASARAGASPAPPAARAWRARPPAPGRGAAARGGARPAPAAPPAARRRRPAGMLTAGLPLRFDGAVSAALFMMARVKPISCDEVPPGNGRRRRPLRLEGHVGVGRAEDEVGLVEEVGHRSVELAPVALDGRRPLEVVALPGALEPAAISGDSSSTRSG